MRVIHRVITMPEDNSTPTGEAGAAQKTEQQTTEPPKDKTFSQEQLNAALKAEKKEWQAKLKDLEGKAAKWDELQEANKSEMERLTGERDTHKTEAEKAKLEALKLRALVKAGAPADKIDALLKRVVGSTPEEIEADVAELAGLGLLAAKTPQGAQGAGNPGLPPKTKDSTLDEQIKTAHDSALKTGNWNLYNALTLQKQGLKLG